MANIPTTLNPQPSAHPVLDFMGGPADPLMLNRRTIPCSARNHVDTRLG